MTNFEHIKSISRLNTWCCCDALKSNEKKVEKTMGLRFFFNKSKLNWLKATFQIEIMELFVRACFLKDFLFFFEMCWMIRHFTPPIEIAVIIQDRHWLHQIDFSLKMQPIKKMPQKSSYRCEWCRTFLIYNCRCVDINIDNPIYLGILSSYV